MDLHHTVFNSISAAVEKLNEVNAVVDRLSQVSMALDHQKLAAQTLKDWQESQRIAPMMEKMVRESAAAQLGFVDPLSKAHAQMLQQASEFSAIAQKAHQQMQQCMPRGMRFLDDWGKDLGKF